MKKLPRNSDQRISIDSLKLRLPLNLCSIKDNRLFDRYVLINENSLKYGSEKFTELVESGSIDIDETVFKEKSLPVRDNGKSTRYAVEIVTGRNSDDELTNVEYLTILINSKLLEKNYFAGIRKDTVKQVYDSLMNHNIVSFTWEHFMKHSICSDIDFKYDLVFKEYKKAFKTMKDKCIPSKFSSKGYRHFDSKTNKGLEFGDRRKATVSNPYIKLYHKRIELFHNSNIFYYKYLQGIIKDNQDLIRIEFTVKNKKFCDKLGIEDLSLYGLLALTQEQKKVILVKYLRKHLLGRTMDFNVDYSQLKPIDKVIVNCMLKYKQNDLDYITMLSELLTGIGDMKDSSITNARKKKSSEVKRSRTKQKLQNLYEKYVEKSEVEQVTANQIDKFFHFIGYDY